MDFQENYAAISDEELLVIAAGRSDLVQEAAAAMDSEMARRGLSYREARAKHREVTRQEYRETTRHRRPPKASKYFVARMNGWALLLVALGVPLLVFLLVDSHVVPGVWDLPVLAASMGAVIAVAAVQPWLKRTASFWLSLVVSGAVQLFVGRWISMHQSLHSRNALKGGVFLAILAGYAVGVVLFLLVRRLNLKQESQGEAVPGVTRH
jgi:hypothetical protein